jgi:signal transduction histidine kinase
LLAVELDQWGKEKSQSNFSEHLSHAQSRITEIAKDVQALSHRLHSSKLDYLGLTTAARSFCKELSENFEVEVQFHHSGVPSTLPKEVSLCLFRVLQEALQNATKYSGVRVFRVNLRGFPKGLELTVSDHGIGFDKPDALSSTGLGLISMRERLQMVHGVLDIQTHPGRGTTISATVPLQGADTQAKAG